jgi:ubiquitin-like 1-activating enzyme E1 B
LKNLAYIGVDHVELVDLDTIDVSNLNRQFLFRPEHVGKPKALVAGIFLIVLFSFNSKRNLLYALKGDMASKFNNDMHVFPHYDNIKSSTFSIEFVATFSIVLNALDNVDARRHVNRLCLAAQVPLIDSGTTGYLGQVNTAFISGFKYYHFP